MIERKHWAAGNKGGKTPRIEVLWINDKCWKAISL